MGKESDDLAMSDAALRVLLMVHELHLRGYQRLRIVPGMSPSGMHWRVTLLPVTRVSKTHGAMPVDRSWGDEDPFYTSGQRAKYFGWEDAQSASPSELADKFTQRFSEALALSRGDDWAYAGWFQVMLSYAQRGELPVAYADWYGEEPDSRWLPTTKGIQSGLPMPPPGEGGG
jgi:hypothetical protein